MYFYPQQVSVYICMKWIFFYIYMDIDNHLLYFGQQRDSNVLMSITSNFLPTIGSLCFPDIFFPWTAMCSCRWSRTSTATSPILAETNRDMGK